MTASFASVLLAQGMPHSDWMYSAAVLRRRRHSTFFASAPGVCLIVPHICDAGEIPAMCRNNEHSVLAPK